MILLILLISICIIFIAINNKSILNNILRCSMAFGRAAPVIKESIKTTSYKASRKCIERYSIKRVDIGSSINHFRNFIDGFVHHIISTCINCIREIKKRLVGYKEINSHKYVLYKYML